MIIMEQGWTGSSDIISGTYTKYHKKYYGIYNFFNIGAYSTKAIPDKIHRGLWWAGGQSGGLSTSYARPWNTRTKAIMEKYRSGHNEPHSKCGCPVPGTWVRIPPSPPGKKQTVLPSVFFMPADVQ